MIDRQRVSLADIDALLLAAGVRRSEVLLRRGEAADEDLVDVTLHRATSREAVAAVLAKLQQLEGVRSLNA